MLRNSQKRFCRLENVLECVETPEKRIYNSTELVKVLPVYPREQPLAENTFFALRNLGKGSVGKYGSITVSYEPVTSFVRDQLLMGFIAKLLRVSYKTVKDRTFLRNLFLSSVGKIKGFSKRFFLWIQWKNFYGSRRIEDSFFKL